MAKVISVKTFQDDRGSLSVIEREIGFSIKRVFYIYGVTKPRGGHGHKRSKTAHIAVNGSVVFSGQTPESDFKIDLDSPSKCLILEPEDWHQMEFSSDGVLLVLASEEFDRGDYFYEKYRE